MLPKDLMKYLEKRDDTIKDLKNRKPLVEGALISDFERYANMYAGATIRYEEASRLGNQLGASTNHASMDLSQYSLQRALRNW